MLSWPKGTPPSVHSALGRTNTRCLPSGDQSGYSAAPLVVTAASWAPVLPSRSVSLPWYDVTRREPSALKADCPTGVEAAAFCTVGLVASTSPSDKRPPMPPRSRKLNARRVPSRVSVWQPTQRPPSLVLLRYLSGVCEPS